MKSFKATALYIALTLLLTFSSLKSRSQCSFTLAANTYLIQSDTGLTAAYPEKSYLICPGVTFDYSDNSHFEHIYIESSGILNMTGYGYSRVFVKSGGTFNANGIQYDSLYYETGAILNDTGGPGFRYKVFCSTITFDYSLLPGGTGCGGSMIISSPDNERPILINPVPAGNFLYANVALSNYDIEIFDMTGKDAEFSLLNNQIIVSSLPVGLYCIRFRDKTSGLTTLRKFAKE